MDKLIESFCSWPGLGQALFVLVILSGASALASNLWANLCRTIQVMLRGHPPPKPSSPPTPPDPEE